MLLFLIILLRCFEPQTCITGVHFPGWVAHWLRTGTILSCGVCTFQAESSPHLPRAYYFRWRNEFLCVASRKVDLKISSFFLFLVLPLFCRCFWPQRCFCSCSICSSYNTLLPSHNKGIWTFFCPPHQHRTRMMGLWFCVLRSPHLHQRLSSAFCSPILLLPQWRQLHVFMHGSPFLTQGHLEAFPSSSL